MNFYNVNTEEYFSGEEYKSIVSFIVNLREFREVNLISNHPTYVVNPRCDKNQTIDYSFVERNIPFFDIPCESLLHKDDSGFVELNEWHYQLNCFMKTIFHRKLWSDWANNNTDKFLEYIWNNWKQCQPNNNFDSIETTAYEIFNRSDTLLEYHQQFIYNPDIVMISLKDTKELFDSLLDIGLFLSCKDSLYEVYRNIPLEHAKTNVKRLYHSGKISKMDIIHVKAKFKKETLPLLQTLNTKYNFIPTGNTDQFEGMWLMQKIEKNIWFIPQFLLFYGKNI